MLRGITFRRLEFGRKRCRVEKCRSTLTAELISWRVRSSAYRARCVKPCPTLAAELHSEGILMLAMRAPHSKGTSRCPFRITLKPVFCRSTLGHCSYFPKAKSPAGADPVRAWCAATQYLDRAPHLSLSVARFVSTTTRAKRRSRSAIHGTWYLGLGHSHCAERLTVILSKRGIKSAIQLTPS